MPQASNRRPSTVRITWNGDLSVGRKSPKIPKMNGNSTHHARFLIGPPVGAGIAPNTNADFTHRIARPVTLINTPENKIAGIFVCFGCPISMWKLRTR
jgi:hypothetical protein